MRLSHGLFLVLAIFFNTQLIAQQLPHFADYQNAAYFFNPAHIEADEKLKVSSQFMNMAVAGFSNGPFTSMSYVRGKIYKSEKQNFLNLTGGIGYTWDKLGGTTMNILKVSLANEITSSAGDRLVIGASFVRNGMLLDVSKVIMITSKPFPRQVVHGVGYDVDAGAYFTTHDNKLKLGFSTLQITEDSIVWTTDPTLPAVNLKRHYFANASYRFKVGEKVHLTPSVLYQGVQYSAGYRSLYIGRASLNFQNDFEFGAQYSYKHYFGTFVYSPILNVFGGEMKFNGMVHALTTGFSSLSYGFQAGVSFTLRGE